MTTPGLIRASSDDVMHHCYPNSETGVRIRRGCVPVVSRYVLLGDVHRKDQASINFVDAVEDILTIDNYLLLMMLHPFHHGSSMTGLSMEIHCHRASSPLPPSSPKMESKFEDSSAFVQICSGININRVYFLSVSFRLTYQTQLFYDTNIPLCQFSCLVHALDCDSYKSDNSKLRQPCISSAFKLIFSV